MAARTLVYIEVLLSELRVIDQAFPAYGRARLLKVAMSERVSGTKILPRARKQGIGYLRMSITRLGHLSKYSLSFLPYCEHQQDIQHEVIRIILSFSQTYG